MAHLDGSLSGSETLAGMAGRSPFHFTRVFSKSVGLTPHRYVVYLRVRRAIELARGSRHGLAEIAARTGLPTRAICRDGSVAFTGSQSNSCSPELEH